MVKKIEVEVTGLKTETSRDYSNTTDPLATKRHYEATLRGVGTKPGAFYGSMRFETADTVPHIGQKFEMVLSPLVAAIPPQAQQDEAPAETLASA